MTAHSKTALSQGVVSFTLVLLSLWTATQWAASALKFHPALGAPVLSIFGWKLYAPWQLFHWWLRFGRSAPRVFNSAGLIAMSGAVACGAVAIGGAAWRASRREVITTYGSARWAATSDISKAGLLNDRGVILGTHGADVLRDEGPHHVLAVAPTRSGKGVGLVVPTLLPWNGSTVVHDLKGENWDLTSGWRQRGSDCFRFDPTDAHSARFNPLLEVRRGLNEVRDVQNIADILIDPEGASPNRNHWQITGHSLLSAAILHVLYAEEEKTLASVARLLSDPARPIGKTLWAMLTTNHLGTDDAPQVHPKIATYVCEVLNKVPNERSGVISTAVSLLSLYRDPIVAAATASSDWQIAGLMDSARPMSLYLVVPPSDLSRTRPLMRLILNQIARRLTEQHEAHGAAERKCQLLLMLDEFPALGRLEFFEQGLAFLAGYGVRAFLITQSLNQLDKAYGVNNAILDNCHVRVAFAANDERTAKRISDMLGTKTELRAQRNLAGKRLSPFLAHTSISEQEVARPLLTPGEVLQLPGDEALIFMAGCPPIRAGKLRYFDNKHFASRQVGAAAVVRPNVTAMIENGDWGTQTRRPHPQLEAQSAALLNERVRQELGIELAPPPVDLPKPGADLGFADDDLKAKPTKRRAAPTPQLALDLPDR
jgi:type IV secretion system protein VirD4